MSRSRRNWAGCCRRLQVCLPCCQCASNAPAVPVARRFTYVSGYATNCVVALRIAGPVIHRRTQQMLAVKLPRDFRDEQAKLESCTVSNHNRWECWSGKIRQFGSRHAYKYTIRLEPPWCSSRISRTSTYFPLFVTLLFDENRLGTRKAP